MESNGAKFFDFEFNVADLLRGKSAVGVEVIYNDDGGHCFNSIVLKSVKSSLEVIQSEVNVKQIEDLSLDPMVPINLVLNGKGIMHKFIEAEEGASDAAILQHVLPNANLDDFYMDKHLATEDRYLVSVLRKDHVDPILEDFSKLGLYVVSASFGPFALGSVKPLLNGSESESSMIQMASHLIQYDEGTISNYSVEDTSKKQIEIGEEKIEDTLMISFAAAFEFLFQKADERLTGAPAIQVAREELKQRKLFQVASYSALALFLVMLMVNFMFFSSYSDTHRELESQLFLSKDRLAYLSNLDQDVNSKRVLLQQLGLLTPARTSFYADAIAASVPKTIDLTGLELNPLLKKVKPGEKPIFNTGSIAITGTSRRSTTLNGWVKLLNEMDWVHNVGVVDYQSTGNRSSGEFELEIGIK